MSKKRKDSAYRSGRSPDWLKMKNADAPAANDDDGQEEAHDQADRADSHSAYGRKLNAAIATKMGIGHGGLYQHLHGEEQPVSGERVAWLTRPRGIRYQGPLQEIINSSTGFLSCWRRQMVLGPGDEFAVIGTSRLALSVPEGWQTRAVERTVLGPAAA